jgi:hypothetical protein
MYRYKVLEVFIFYVDNTSLCTLRMHFAAAYFIRRMEILLKNYVDIWRLQVLFYDYSITKFYKHVSVSFRATRLGGLGRIFSSFVILQVVFA